jgi:hypothetical protein
VRPRSTTTPRARWRVSVGTPAMVEDVLLHNVRLPRSDRRSPVGAGVLLAASEPPRPVRVVNGRGSGHTRHAASEKTSLGTGRSSCLCFNARQPPPGLRGSAGVCRHALCVFMPRCGPPLAAATQLHLSVSALPGWSFCVVVGWSTLVGSTVSAGVSMASAASAAGSGSAVSCSSGCGGSFTPASTCSDPVNPRF